MWAHSGNDIFCALQTIQRPSNWKSYCESYRGSLKLAAKFIIQYSNSEDGKNKTVTVPPDMVKNMRHTYLYHLS